MKEKQIKFDIDNGVEFFADEASVMHNPIKVFIDFRRTSPRSDIRLRDFQPLITRHNVIMMDPFVAKSLLETLKKNLDDYEKSFGKIRNPPAIEKAQKKAAGKKNKTAAPEKSTAEVPSYFG